MSKDQGRYLGVQCWRLALVGALIFATSYLCLDVPRGLGRVSPIWLSNAVMLAFLLTASRSCWTRLVLAGGTANLLASLAAGDALEVAVGLTLAHAAEYTVAAIVLVKLLGRRADIGRPRDLATFALVALATSAMSAVLAIPALGPSAGLQAAILWGVTDFAAMVIVTPCVLLLLLNRGGLASEGARPAWPLALLAAVNLATFIQDRYALAYLVVAASMLVAWRAGLVGAALGVILTLVIALAATVAGRGPFALGPGEAIEQVLMLQAFLAVCFYVSVPVALQRRRARQLASALRGALRRTRQAEARYRLIAERMHDVVVRYDREGRLLYVSPSSAWTLGYEPEELIGTDPGDLVHPDDRAHLEANVRDFFVDKPDDAGGVGEREHRFRAKSGAYIWLEGNPTVLKDANGRPYEVLNVMRDITARKAMEAELEAARQEAEAAARVKSEFLANMSHELRTPLTSIVGFTRLALEQPDLAPLARTYVERVGDASRALLSTVNDVLDFSKLEAGQVSFQPQPTPLVPLLRSTLSLFEPQAGAKDLGLHLDAELDEQAAVLIDPDRLRQVLLNLVGNAVKFTAEGSVTLRARLDEAAETLSISVEDTGPGIAPEAQEKLFQRFSQVDGTLTRAFGGTGLGLAICKGIVEALGGTIGVRSTAGRGSTFHVSIRAPRALAPAQARDAAGPGPVWGVRALVVDDHSVNRELAQLFLAGVGVEVTQACGGAEAVELAARWPYDVILMDLRMPQIDGQEALRRIRAGGGPNDATPILAFTADADPQLQSQLAALGFEGLVAKPLEPQALISAVASATSPAPEETLRHAG